MNYSFAEHLSTLPCQLAMEKVVLDYGAATARNMRAPAADGLENESRRVKHVIDKMSSTTATSVGDCR